MKIALSISSPHIDAPLDQRFGRASHFLIVESESQAVSYIDNAEQKEASQGAGIQVAQMLVQAGVKAIITGHCGPKAFLVLTQNDIAVYATIMTSATEALKCFESGQLVRLQAPQKG